MILWVFIKFFGVKIVITDIYQYLPIFTDIYRYLPIFYRYLPIFTDILPIFFQKFLHKRACSTIAIFRWKNRFFPIFRRKIGDFTDFSPIFPLIDFSSDFSSRCRPKTDFSAKYRPKKPIFCSLVLSTNLSHISQLKYLFQIHLMALPLPGLITMNSFTIHKLVLD